MTYHPLQVADRTRLMIYDFMMRPDLFAVTVINRNVSLR